MEGCTACGSGRSTAKSLGVLRAHINGETHTCRSPVTVTCDMATSQSAEKVCRLHSRFAQRLNESFRRPGALGELFRSPRSIVRVNGPTKCGAYLLASSLAAALLDSLFEHPAGASTINLPTISGPCRAKTEFFSKLLAALGHSTSLEPNLLLHTRQ